MTRVASDKFWQAEARSKAVYTGRHPNVMQRRKEVKMRTLQARMNYNRTIWEQGNGL